MTQPEQEARDREVFAAAWGEHPQWADVRSNILTGACDVLSDPISLACSIALKAMARLKEPTPAKTGERGAVIEECARVAELCSFDEDEFDGGSGIVAGRVAKAIRALSQPLPDAPIVGGEGAES